MCFFTVGKNALSESRCGHAHASWPPTSTEVSVGGCHDCVASIEDRIQSITATNEGRTSWNKLVRSPQAPAALSPDLLEKMDAYWRAANYLTVGQIYLQDNPLLETSLKLEHIKPRLLGHWGTTTGLNFSIYVHLNRLITEHDLNMIYVIGPGHGGPGLVAHSYLEGSYTERYPNIERSRNGLQRLFRQFSWPYGIPSHVAPETPGSIHEGGELGYSLVHAYGAAFDNPDLIVACIIGDGEAETGALATSWHSNKFLNPARDGAVSFDPSSQWIQDRQSYRARAHQPQRIDRPDPRLWL